MNVMIKINRALKKAKISVVELNDGEQKIAEKKFSFLFEGKQLPLTLRSISSEKENLSDKVEIILWDSVSCVSGKSFNIENATKHIPGFDLNHPLFSQELEKLKRKSEPQSRKDNRIILSGKSNYMEIYPDE